MRESIRQWQRAEVLLFSHDVVASSLVVLWVDVYRARTTFAVSLLDSGQMTSYSIQEPMHRSKWLVAFHCKVKRGRVQRPSSCLRYSATPSEYHRALGSTYLWKSKWDRAKNGVEGMTSFSKSLTGEGVANGFKQGNGRRQVALSSAGDLLVYWCLQVVCSAGTSQEARGRTVRVGRYFLVDKVLLPVYYSTYLLPRMPCLLPYACSALMSSKRENCRIRDVQCTCR